MGLHIAPSRSDLGISGRKRGVSYILEALAIDIPGCLRPRLLEHCKAGRSNMRAYRKSRSP